MLAGSGTQTPMIVLTGWPMKKWPSRPLHAAQRIISSKAPPSAAAGAFRALRHRAQEKMKTTA
jgi:hypothetical protein